MRIALAALVSIAVAVAAVSAQRVTLYNAPIALWTQALADGIPDCINENNLGMSLVDTGRTAEALPHFERAVSFGPLNYQARANLAVALEQLGRPAESLMHYEVILAHRPQDAKARYNYGVALMRLGQSQDAAEQFRRAIELRPDYVEPVYNLAVVYRRLGRFGEARSTMESARQLAVNRGQTDLAAKAAEWLTRSDN